MRDAKPPAKTGPLPPVVQERTLRYYLVERDALAYYGDMRGTEEREQFIENLLADVPISEVSGMVVILGREVPLTISTPTLTLGE